MKANKLIYFAAIIGVATSLTACGNKSNTSSQNSNTIVFWNNLTGADGKSMQKMVREYNKTNPKYKVKNVSMTEGDLYAKIPTVVNSGSNIPDVTIVHAERIRLYKASNMLTTWDKMLTSYPEIKGSNYVKQAWDVGNLDGKRYSVPLDVHSFMMYYNTKLVKKYAPHALADNVVTFDEIIDAGQKAKKDGIKAVAVTWMKPLFLSLLAQEGGNMADAKGNPTINTPEAKKALEQWTKMRKMGITTKDGQDTAQQFAKGNVIFYPEGIWMQNQVRLVKFDWGFTNSPQLSSDINKTVNWSSSHQFVMFKCKDRTAAKEKAVGRFVNWMRTHSEEWAKAGQNPASLAITKSKVWKNMPQSMLMKNEAETKTMKIFDYKYNGFVSEAVDQYIPDVVWGKNSIDSGLQKVQSQVEAKIKQNQH